MSSVLSAGLDSDATNEQDHLRCLFSEADLNIYDVASSTFCGFKFLATVNR